MSQFFAPGTEIEIIEIVLTPTRRLRPKRRGSRQLGQTVGIWRIVRSAKEAA